MTAQEVVHALTGTVSSIDKNTVAVLQDVGGRAVFENPSKSVRLRFDKDIQDDTVSADAFKDKGAYAIVFYYGLENARKVVAFKKLGPGPFASTIGTVKEFDKSHFVIVQDKSGKTQRFEIGSKTVAESYAGAEDGTDFQADKGDRVRIVSEVVNGQPTVLFMRHM